LRNNVLEFVAEGKAAACAGEEKAREGGGLVGVILKVRAVLVQQGYWNMHDNLSEKV
jgi:hypothetical protein